MNVFVGTENTSMIEISESFSCRPNLLTVQLFQSELLSLPHKAEDHEPREEIESSVEANYGQVQQIVLDYHPAVSISTYKHPSGS